jgi:hypothetical protein
MNIPFRFHLYKNHLETWWDLLETSGDYNTHFYTHHNFGNRGILLSGQ